MKCKSYTWGILLFLCTLYSCQKNTELSTLNSKKTTPEEIKITLNHLRERIHYLSFFYEKSTMDEIFHVQKSKTTRSGFPAPDTGQMPIPYLHPNGESEEDIYFKNAFFNILEMQETLRELLENFNKFIIHTNLNILTHPAQIHNSIELQKMINFRKTIQEEITFVHNAIQHYNNRINTYFPTVSHSHKMAGYYSFDNTHISYNQTEFSIEDVDNFSYSYHQNLITKNILKSKNAKLKLQQPQVGTRRGTVFVNAGRPNVIRGAFGNDFGGYALGVVVGMTIEYAITGKIYYYKGAL